MSIFDDKREDKALERIADALEDFSECFCSLVQHLFAATDFRLNDAQGDPQMISPVQAGSSKQYRASLVPANAVALQSGPTFASSDPLAVLTQDTTDPFLVTAAVDASDTAASFNITVSGVNSAGNSISHVFLIPISQAPPPVALDFDLNDA